LLTTTINLGNGNNYLTGSSRKRSKIILFDNQRFKAPTAPS
jgi:hypothetical protein